MPKIDSSLSEILGKTIVGVLVNDIPTCPRRQVFLVFSDRTYYELYSSSGDIDFASGVDKGDMDAVERYAAKFPGVPTKFV